MSDLSLRIAAHKQQVLAFYDEQRQAAAELFGQRAETAETSGAVESKWKARKEASLEERVAEVLGRETYVEAQNARAAGRGMPSSVLEYCQEGTAETCRAAWAARFGAGTPWACGKVHFKQLITENTEKVLGDCSYLDTCRHADRCHFVHYAVDTSGGMDARIEEHNRHTQERTLFETQGLPAPQWINCDIRKFDMNILGRFGVIMADPPWDIHMTLPYGTMTDEEMKAMNIQCLMEDGLFFLWVTGRAMELGRECLRIWGYKLIEEIVWVKVNQLQRLIRTGRTGHWMNHTKEHCLVGIKGNPRVPKHFECDVIVSEVRETSRKPDEIYGIIERLMPGARKLELFGRKNNLRHGWTTLGNQLDAWHIDDPCVQCAVESKYGSFMQAPGIIINKK